MYLQWIRYLLLFLPWTRYLHVCWYFESVCISCLIHLKMLCQSIYICGDSIVFTVGCRQFLLRVVVDFRRRDYNSFLDHLPSNEQFSIFIFFNSKKYDEESILVVICMFFYTLSFSYSALMNQESFSCYSSGTTPHYIPPTSRVVFGAGMEEAKPVVWNQGLRWWFISTLFNIYSTNNNFQHFKCTPFQVLITSDSADLTKSEKRTILRDGISDGCCVFAAISK